MSENKMFKELVSGPARNVAQVDGTLGRIRELLNALEAGGYNTAAGSEESLGSGKVEGCGEAGCFDREASSIERVSFLLEKKLLKMREALFNVDEYQTYKAPIFAQEVNNLETALVAVRLLLKKPEPKDG